MNRRNLLMAAGAGSFGIAGCTGGLFESTHTPEIEIEVDGLPQALDDEFEGTVELIEEFSEDHPARLQIDLTYLDGNSESNTATLGFGDTPPYSWYVGGTGAVEDYDNRIFLIPDTRDNLEAITDAREPDAWVPDEPIDGCWETTGPPSVPIPGEPHEVVVEPGDVLTERYTLISSFANEDCLPAGAYQFGTQEPYFIESESLTWETADGEYPLSFAIQVIE